MEDKRRWRGMVLGKGKAPTRPPLSNKDLAPPRNDDAPETNGKAPVPAPPKSEK